MGADDDAGGVLCTAGPEKGGVTGRDMGDDTGCPAVCGADGADGAAGLANGTAAVGVPPPAAGPRGANGGGAAWPDAGLTAAGADAALPAAPGAAGGRMKGGADGRAAGWVGPGPNGAVNAGVRRGTTSPDGAAAGVVAGEAAGAAVAGGADAVTGAGRGAGTEAEVGAGGDADAAGATGAGAAGEDDRAGAGEGTCAAVGAGALRLVTAGVDCAAPAVVVDVAAVAFPAVVESGAKSGFCSASRVMVMTPPQTEHRARTLAAGTFSGSTRKIEWHSGQATFIPSLRSSRRSPGR